MSLSNSDPSTIAAVQGLQRELLPGVREAVAAIDRVLVYPALCRLFGPKPLEPVRLEDYHGVLASAGKVRRWLREDKRKNQTYFDRWGEAQRYRLLPRPNKSGDVYHFWRLPVSAKFDVQLSCTLAAKHEGPQDPRLPRFFSMGCTMDIPTAPEGAPGRGLKCLAVGALPWTPTPPKEDL